MFGKRITLFTIFGFTVRLDLSWFLLALLVTYSTSRSFQQPPDAFPVQMAWLMGGAIAIGLLVSIVAHELTHSLVARLHGMRIKGITLFFLGGVAEMEDEPPTPWAEFTMAIVGPIASAVVAAILFGGFRGAEILGWPSSVTAVLKYLASLNLMLAVFNMVPGFPLDGGRVLRSVLWGIKGNQRWATRIASGLGVGFGVLLVAAGLFFVFMGPRELGAIMWIVIGIFLMGAARVPYRQLVLRESLQGVPARQFMDADPVVVPRWIPLAEFLQDYVYKQRERVFAVVDHAGLAGIISADSMKSIPQAEWASRSVGELTSPMPPEWMMAENESAERALDRMARGGLPQLFVIEQGRLAGVVRLSAIAEFLQLRRDLEGK